MRQPLSSHARIPIALLLVLVAGTAGAWLQLVQAQAPAQIGTSSPLPVFVTNPGGYAQLPQGFVQGTRWRFTSWTTPSAIVWTASVNKISGGWANLTISQGDQGPIARWYFVPAMPGSWDPQ